MFKWTFLERENIVESRTGLHLSLPSLDIEIMAIKDVSKALYVGSSLKENLMFVYQP